MADLYELLSQAVKNTKITINFATKPSVAGSAGSEEPTEDEPKAEDDIPSCSAPVDAEPHPRESGLVRDDFVQLISDLENVSATLKRINRSLVGHECTEAFFMLQNFDKILTSVKMVVNAV